MEDKFLDGMVNTSISMMKRLSEGGTLTPDELKFILLTKQMSEKANKQNKSNPLGGLLEGLKPIHHAFSKMFYIFLIFHWIYPPLLFQATH